jgi:hypothetical protein
VRGTTLKRRGATTLGDLPRLTLPAERTTVVRGALLLALAAALAGAVLLARSAGSGRAAVLPGGVRTGELVIDMSASDVGQSFERISTVMDGLASANQAMGLIMFSDTAYELLPPNSPSSALLQFDRFFTPTTITHGAPIYGQSPWNRFSGGTRIASGLKAGADALRRAQITHGSLLLLSDLNDSAGDLSALVAESLALRREHIPVRIVPLYATTDNVKIFASLFGYKAFVSPTAFKTKSTRHVQPIAVAWPWALIGVGVLLVALLTANEHFNSRLQAEPAA